MTRRFTLALPDNLYNEFLRHYPDRGQRTVILRRVVQHIIRRAQVIGTISDYTDYEAEQLVHTVKKEGYLED